MDESPVNVENRRVRGSSHTETVVISGRALASAWLASYAGGSPGSWSLLRACRRSRRRAPQGFSRLIHGYQQQKRTPSGNPRIMPMKKPLTIRWPSLPSLNMWSSTLCAELGLTAAADLFISTCTNMYEYVLVLPKLSRSNCVLISHSFSAETKLQIWPVCCLAEHWRSLLADSRPAAQPTLRHCRRDATLAKTVSFLH